MISISNDSKHIKSWKYTKILFPKSSKTLPPLTLLTNSMHITLCLLRLVERTSDIEITSLTIPNIATQVDME